MLDITELPYKMPRRECPRCGGRLYRNQDLDWECLMCGAVVYTRLD